MPKTGKYPKKPRIRQTGTGRMDPDMNERGNRPKRIVAATIQRLANPEMDWKKDMPKRGFPKTLPGRAKPRGNR